MHGGKHVWDRGAMFHMNINRRVANLMDEMGLPVILESRWDKRIEQTLQNRMRDGPNHIEGRRQKRADRFEDVLGPFHRPGVAPDDATHGAIVKMLGKRRS